THPGEAPSPGAPACAPCPAVQRLSYSPPTRTTRSPPARTTRQAKYLQLTGHSVTSARAAEMAWIAKSFPAAEPDALHQPHEHEDLEQPITRPHQRQTAVH
ncbi:hypothetical protein, partial [Nocardia alni]|uniref:hypothetical protein n=1 Tax=Nocardia alni TaxID=2815723 RepID=UPI001C241A22